MADLLPPNATRLERAIAAANAQLGELPVPLRELTNPDTCPADKLPWLASYMSVDSWDASWSIAQQRASIKNSLPIHRIKGTIGAVRGALSALGVGVRLQEWFNQIPAGAPYTYRLLLDINQVGIDQPTMQMIQKVVDNTKNLRSHLTAISTTITSDCGPSVLAASGTGHEIEVSYGAPDLDLLMEGAQSGMEITEDGVNLLHHQLHVIMATDNYW